MYLRQKLLLALLQVFGGRLSHTALQKYLFLFMQTFPEKDRKYAFVPYQFGCFSFQSYDDLRKLKAANIVLEQPEKWELVDSGEDYLSAVDADSREKLFELKQQYAGFKGDQKLMHEVYRQYPYYAIRSTQKERLLSKEELHDVEAVQPAKRAENSGDAFFTIGYEGRSIDQYLNLLIRNNIRMLCDVRRNPFSRKYGFSRKTLSETLKKLDVQYEHLPELGIAAEKRRFLDSAAARKALFDQYERSTLKQNGTSLEKLQTLCNEFKRVAVGCFEADHHMCHRGRIARAMQRRPGWSHETVHL